MNVPFELELGFVESMESWAKGFPDGQIEITNLVAQDDIAVAEFTGRGTHTGPLKGPTGEIPLTNRRVELPLVEIYRFTVRNIAEGKVYFESATFFAQLSLGRTSENKELVRAAFFRVVDGKVAEHWAQTDTLGLLRQIGGTPGKMADIVEPPGALI